MEPDLDFLARRFLRAEIMQAGDPGYYNATMFLADNSPDYRKADSFDAEVVLAQFRRSVRNEARRMIAAFYAE